MGISGGQKGALEGPSLMIGGDRKAYETVKKDLNNIAAKDSKGNPCCSFLGSVEQVIILKWFITE